MEKNWNTDEKRSDTFREQAQHTAHDVKEGALKAKHNAEEKVQQKVDRFNEKATEYKNSGKTGLDRTAGKFEQAGEKIKHTVKEQATQAAHTVQEKAGQAADYIQEKLH